MPQKRLAEPEVVEDPSEYMKVAKSASELEEVVRVYRAYQTKADQLEEARALMKDSNGSCGGTAESDDMSCHRGSRNGGIGTRGSS